MMPPVGAEARARHLSVLGSVVHTMFTADETGRLLKAASDETIAPSPDSTDFNTLRVARRDYERARKLPTDRVAETTPATTLAHEVWATASKDNEYKSFIPPLQKIL